MGIDWIPFKSKRVEDSDTIKALADRQGRAFQAMPELWSTEPLPLFSSEVYDADRIANRSQHEEYTVTSRDLNSLIEFGMSDQYPGHVDSFRVYVITHWRFIPPQWRCRAHRTITSDCLPQQLNAWQEWISAVRCGSMRRYLVRLYLYYARMGLYAAWCELKEGVSLVRQLTNSWVSRDCLQQLCSEIDAMPQPFLLGAPLEIPKAFNDQPIEAEQLRMVASTEAESSAMLGILRQWNRNVKKGQTGHWELASFDQFLEPAHDPWIDEFFEWANRWADRGLGLFLDS
jgi:hypothetical protein